jgi:hypothetical protein
MKKTNLEKFHVMFLAFVVAGALNAQPPKGKATPGSNYGDKTTADNTKPASELINYLNSKDTIAVKVKGKVNDVCSKRGCWLTLRVNDSTEAFVKMHDYGFFVPTDLSGKTVVLEGETFVKTTTVDELRHYAEDAKKPKTEIEAITQAKKELRLIAKGILVVE